MGRRGFFRLLQLPESKRTVVKAMERGLEVERFYPKTQVSNISELSEGDSVAFRYPDENHPCTLLVLDRKATGGVGEDESIVAFSSLCPHMGCGLKNTEFESGGAMMGPCACHFSSFDPARGGMQVQGVATQDLPQVILEVEGDEVFAVGIRGLVYGRNDNMVGGAR